MAKLDEKYPVVRNSWINFLIMIILAFFSIKACSFINKRANLKPDNVYEQIAEAVIKSETGLDIDLSPEEN